MPGVFFTAMDGGGCRKCRSIFARHGWRTCRPLSAIHGLRGTWAPARRKCRMHFSARPALYGGDTGLSRPSMASEGRSRPSWPPRAAHGLPWPSRHSGSLPVALGLLPGGNAGAFLPAMDSGHADLSRPSMASEALGLLPGENAGCIFRPGPHWMALGQKADAPPTCRQPIDRGPAPRVLQFAWPSRSVPAICSAASAPSARCRDLARAQTGTVVALVHPTQPQKARTWLR